MCFLSDNIYDYYNVSQGKITIPSMDDGEEFSLTDVSPTKTKLKLNRIEFGLIRIIFLLYVFCDLCFLLDIRKTKTKQHTFMDYYKN